MNTDKLIKLKSGFDLIVQTVEHSDVDNHFVDVNKMVELGSGAQ